MGVQPGPGGGPAQRQLPDPRERCAHAVGAQRDLRRVSGELLAERDRHGVHQVRATGLDDVRELSGPRGEGGGEGVHRGQQVRVDLAEGRDVHGGGEHVVRRLAHVHVVVGVGGVAGEVRDHLVGVHVRRGAGAGLEDIHRELVVVLARGHGLPGGRDPLGEIRIHQAQFGVRPCRGGLDPAEGTDDGRWNRLAGDREILDRLDGLVAPKLL